MTSPCCVELLGTTQFASLGGTQRTALQCHFGDGLLPIAGRDREGDRHRFEIVAFTQLRIPMVVLIFRSERADVPTGIILADLHSHGPLCSICHITEKSRDWRREPSTCTMPGRLMHAGAPCGGGAHGESRAGLAGIDDLIRLRTDTSRSGRLRQYISTAHAESPQNTREWSILPQLTRIGTVRFNDDTASIGSGRAGLNRA